MSADVMFEIFQMPSSENEFYIQYPFLEKYRTIVRDYKAESRRKEILSEHILLNKFFPGEDVTLTHNADGMPILSNGMNISISHTRGFVALIVSKEKRVALDIEYINERVRRVGRMFLREDEPFTEIHDMLVVWCVKETMYKLYSSMKLSFEEIRVRPFSALPEGMVVADNLRTNETITLEYRVTDKYVLTTACK